ATGAKRSSSGPSLATAPSAAEIVGNGGDESARDTWSITSWTVVCTPSRLRGSAPIPGNALAMSPSSSTVIRESNPRSPTSVLLAEQRHQRIDLLVAAVTHTERLLRCLRGLDRPVRLRVERSGRQRHHGGAAALVENVGVERDTAGPNLPGRERELREAVFVA